MNTLRYSANFRISELCRDPIVRAAFQRAERDGGQAAAVAVVTPSNGQGGAGLLVKIIRRDLVQA